MARSVYYQSVGNPLQIDRLPDRSPALAFPLRPPPAGETAILMLMLLLGALAVVILSTNLVPAAGAVHRGNWGEVLLFVALAAAALYFIRRRYDPIPLPHALAVYGAVVLLVLSTALADYARRFPETDTPRFGGWLELWFGLIVVVAALYSAFRRQLIWLLATLPYVGGVYASLRIATTPASIQLAASAAISLLTWRFGCHWAAICTAAPLQRDQAHALRHEWRGHLAVAALAPPAAVLVCLTLDCRALAAPFLTLLIFVQFFQTLLSPTRAQIIPAVSGALISWLTYNHGHRRLPGIFQSPSGPWCARIALSAGSLVLVTVACAQLEVGLPVVSIFTSGGLWLPLVMTLIAPVGLTLPVLADAAGYRRAVVTPDDWPGLVRDVRTSPDPIERRSIYRGRIAADGTPLLVPREVFDEHAHFLGDSGSCKTSAGLAPTMEQLLATGEASMVVLDLKADSLELLGALRAAADEVLRTTGRVVPIRHFTNQSKKATFGFNVLAQPFWRDFELYMRTDILCGALGLHYGSDYGEGYYSSANAAVLYHTIKCYPEATTFRELAQRVGYIVANAKRHELHPEVRKAGVHVQEVLKRLGAFEALNVSAEESRPREVLGEAIDLATAFRQPSVFYFHLSASLSPGSSPEIARLVAYFLLCAATQTERRCRVYLVIDEFQRMVARNIEYLLQLARSMGVSVILANQTLQDLKTSTADLIPAIEANCRYREWFSVSASADREHLLASSGQTIDLLAARTQGTNDRGVTTASLSVHEVLLPRFSANDILLASDHPKRSIVRISRGAGYAQYGGLPFIVEHEFHITREEYLRRKALDWPKGLPGTFVPGGDRPEEFTKTPAGTSGPVVTREVIGDEPPAGEPLSDNPFDSFFQARSSPPRRRRRKRRHDP